MVLVVAGGAGAGLVLVKVQVRSDPRLILEKEPQEFANRFYVECERTKIQDFLSEQLKICNCYLIK